ncbi:MAG: hypothetical protein CMA21_02560 [Euryarchaeota archaeon]|nr:hypothetical protein [Euryarchaeota archaeon]
MDSIEWIRINPGSTYLGSNNRAIIFGSPGPRHEVPIQHSYEISKEAIPLSKALSLCESSDLSISSESEWQLAYDRGLIREGRDIEVLEDRISSSYWGKVCDGRAFLTTGSSLVICREWVRNKAITNYLPPTESTRKLARMVRRGSEYNSPIAPRLPKTPPTKRILLEEISIIILLGIIPSFLWAHFNASPGYIETGWPGLILGGVILGLFSGLFWRPKQPTWWAEGSKMFPRR